ncbi:HNH endonuclease [Prauserella endophytica]|uniref:HNH endonuclease n=1 Tax=Prauserella endophytica TaxID=1592324 RepID=UPI001981782E|nr:HNH endonuclease [Prauserella endophytica]
MTWLRLDDVGYDDPLVRAIGNGAYGALVRMKQYASAQRTDGWLPADKAREIASRAELRALTNVRLGDDPPMLHQPGDDCPCLTDKTWPVTGTRTGGYWVHGFLDRNPSRAENDVHKAKRRELRDKELRRAVRDRDGNHCRYCGRDVRWADRKTDAGGVLDHVDPAVAAGAANLVVACRGCNGRKKDCTPEAAGMTLLDPPEINTRSTTDPPPITDRSPTDQPREHRTAPDPAADPAPDPHPATTTARAAEQQTNAQAAPTKRDITAPINGPMTTGPGRGGHGPDTAPDRAYRHRVGDAGPRGHRPTVGPATTPRSHLAPNPYLKSRTSNPSRPDDHEELCVHHRPLNLARGGPDCPDCRRAIDEAADREPAT